jgi:modified peptide precursor CbpA
MSQTIQTPAAQPTPTMTSAKPQAAPTIAIRKSCNPEGIGLSHYVLMDKKAAK